MALEAIVELIERSSKWKWGPKHVKMVLNHPHRNPPFYLELSTDAVCREGRVGHMCVNQRIYGNDTLVA